MSTVIFALLTAPTVDEHLQEVSSKHIDEQGSLFKGSVTTEWLKEACYAGGRLWGSSMVTTL